MSTRIAKSTYLGTRYITDGKTYGLVKETNDNSVFVVDTKTGKQHRIHVNLARRMTPREIEQYNSVPSKHDPAPDQLAMRTAEIRASWDDKTRYAREQPRHLKIGELIDV